jgi:hypothetical protein
MAVDKLIPKIEWNPLAKTGDTTSGDPNVSDIASTTDIIVGMFVTGPGIPADTTVLSKGANSIVLSSNATATAGDAALSFIQRFEFEYPPTKDSDNQIDPSEKVTTSLSGARQVQIDYLEEKRDLEFSFLTSEEHLELRNLFYIPWAVLGYEFKYFPDKADTAFETYELADMKFAPKRQVKKHPSFLYGLAIKMRRIL